MAGQVKALVLDSGPLIKGAKPETISHDVYTIREVVSEIRDATTRQRLAVLPYELKFREPSPSSVKFVSDFAKKTGDFSVLSATDVRVIALAYQLLIESDSAAASSIRDSPVTATQGASTVMQPTTSSGHTAGFYMPKGKMSSSSARPSRAGSQHASVSEDCVASEAACDTTSAQSGDSQTEAPAAEQGDAGAEGAASAAGDAGMEDEEAGEGAAMDDDDDDDEGWITPDNLAATKKAMSAGDVEEVSTELPVACMTTDYAMQNVLLQIGLPVLSVDGMVIRTVRSYVMRCTACMKVATKATSAFCPRCGNDSLVRIVAHTSSDGQVNYGNMGPKALNQRGVRYSLPTPKGGRLAVNPVVNPDQKVTYRPPRSRNAPLNAMEADYVTGSSPFAMNDVTSRGVNIAFRNQSTNSAATHRAPGQRRTNPNASRPKRNKK